jgi:CRP-like cAMP-binding protein
MTTNGSVWGAPRNGVLNRLSPTQFATLAPHLEPVDLPVRRKLELHNAKVEHLYFLEDGIASVVTDGGRAGIEVGIIGSEGMTGHSVLLGYRGRLQHETFMQVAGRGYRIPAGVLLDKLTYDLHKALLPDVQIFLSQTMRNATVNGCSKLGERLARWLLMVCDRTVGDEILLTHDFLSIMLAVRRPGVSAALASLEEQALITRRRGTITILDRAALKVAANGAYRTGPAG